MDDTSDYGFISNVDLCVLDCQSELVPNLKFGLRYVFEHIIEILDVKV
jgi:hypothetical protein